MSETESDRVPEGDMTVAWVANTMVDAQLARDALREAGIPCIVEDFSLNPYDGLWVSQKGWGRVLVGKREVAKAREVITRAFESDCQADEAAGEGWE